MNNISPNIVRTEEPDDSLCKAMEMAAFLAFVASQIGYHGSGHEMPEEAWYGLATILDDMHERISTANTGFEELLETKEAATLTRMGLPKQAYADRSLRESWRSGFAHGLAYRKEEALGNGTQ